MRSVHFGDMLPQPVPAIHVAAGDTTFVDGGSMSVSSASQCALEIVYRWRTGGVPGGETVAETLMLTYETTAPFQSYGSARWYRLLRGADHVGYVLQLNSGDLILNDYDHAGTVDFTFRSQ